MSSDAIIASCLLHANTSPDCVDGSLVVAAYVGCFCQYIPMGEKTNQMVWEHRGFSRDCDLQGTWEKVKVGVVVSQCARN